MALCLAQSLVDKKGFDIEDQLDKYLLWFMEWYMSSTGRPFGIGRQTAHQLFEYKRYKECEIQEKPREKDLSGQKKDSNGSLMRVGPIPLYFFDDIEKAIYYAGESVKPTHNTDLCVDSAKYFVGLIIGALLGENKKTLLNWNYSPIPGYREKNKMHQELQKIVNGSYKTKAKEEIWAKYGYVLDSLEAALWGFYHTDNFEDGLVDIINLWNDADTNWCIYGYLAWAYYGYDQIPSRWKEGVAKKTLIEKLTMGMYHKS